MYLINLKKISHLFFIFIFFFSFSSLARSSASIEIENAWSPEAPPAVKVMAGYMKINNHGNKDIKILSAKSTLFKKVEIHKSEMKNGMMRMTKQNNLLIKANNHIELKPGGLHMMLMGKLKAIKSDSVIPVSIKFNNGETIHINLKVKNSNRSQMKCGSGKCGSM